MQKIMEEAMENNIVSPKQWVGLCKTLKINPEATYAGDGFKVWKGDEGWICTYDYFGTEGGSAWKAYRRVFAFDIEGDKSWFELCLMESMSFD